MVTSQWMNRRVLLLVAMSFRHRRSVGFHLTTAIVPLLLLHPCGHCGGKTATPPTSPYTMTTGDVQGSISSRQRHRTAVSLPPKYRSRFSSVNSWGSNRLLRKGLEQRQSIEVALRTRRGFVRDTGLCHIPNKPLYQRTRQVLMAHQERPIYAFHW